VDDGNIEVYVLSQSGIYRCVNLLFVYLDSFVVMIYVSALGKFECIILTH